MKITTDHFKRQAQDDSDAKKAVGYATMSPQEREIYDKIFL